MTDITDIIDAILSDVVSAITDLRDESAAAGDLAAENICKHALGGDKGALVEALGMLGDSLAQDEDLGLRASVLHQTATVADEAGNRWWPSRAASELLGEDASAALALVHLTSGDFGEWLG